MGIVGLVMCIAATESETFQKQMPHRDFSGIGDGYRVGEAVTGQRVKED